ncbi:unnamed protein product [Microthlaspi erraticum]|uniref:Uncharacterized protein n=1 Tax=Microthlaspi erraticum TaxID=1685480 RepID=A0A6D2KZZ9_9BRAS|nr:unnamed protein product [Microthlaspi erraticum]
MDGAPRGHSVRGRSARGRGGKAGGIAGGRAGPGRGRGLPEELGESVAPSVATASVPQSVSVASEASVDASVGLGSRAAPGGGAAPAPGCDDLVVGLLMQLLARFPPVVPQGAPGVPPLAEAVQPGAAGAGVSRYVDMIGHMQRIGTPFSEGRVSPEEADAWR